MKQTCRGSAVNEYMKRVEDNSNRRGLRRQTLRARLFVIFGIGIVSASIHADHKDQFRGAWQTDTGRQTTHDSWSADEFAGTDLNSSMEVIVVEDSRPLAKAVAELETQFGWIITYEDPPYTFRGDISDVTAIVRRDLDKYLPGEAPRVLVPKGGKFVFHYDAGLSHDPLMLLRQLVVAYQRDIGAANFQVEKSNRAFHVIPVAVRGVSGRQIVDRSPLNVVIALPVKVRTGLQELEEICSRIGQLTHRHLVVGTIPNGMFSKSLGKRGGTPIIARRALDDLLEKTGNGVKLSWRLLYGPDTKMYALNIHEVRYTK